MGIYWVTQSNLWTVITHSSWIMKLQQPRGTPLFENADLLQVSHRRNLMNSNLSREHLSQLFCYWLQRAARPLKAHPRSTGSNVETGLKRFPATLSPFWLCRAFFPYQAQYSQPPGEETASQNSIFLLLFLLFLKRKIGHTWFLIHSLKNQVYFWNS